MKHNMKQKIKATENQAPAGLDIEIHLKPIAGGAHSKTLPPNITNIIQLEYATKYLEAIGAQTTRENIDYVLQHLPLSKTTMQHLWTRDLIIIHTAPNKNSDGNEQKELAIDDMGSQTTSSSRKNSVLFENTKSSHTQSYSSTSKGDDISDDFNFTNYRIKPIDTNASSHNNYNAANTPNNINSSKSQKNETAKQKNDLRNKASLDPNSLFKPLVQVLKANPSMAATFRGMLKPPSYGQEDILQPVKVFVACLGDYVPSIKSDKKGNLFKTVRRVLLSASCVRLYGLLTHFCYWNIIHPAARSTIKDMIDSNITVAKGYNNNPIGTTPSKSALCSHHSPQHVQQHHVRIHTPVLSSFESTHSHASQSSSSHSHHPTTTTTGNLVTVAAILEVDSDGNLIDKHPHDTSLSHHSPFHTSHHNANNKNDMNSNNNKVLQDRANLPAVLRQSKHERDSQLQAVSEFISESIEKTSNMLTAQSSPSVRHNSQHTVEQIFNDVTKEELPDADHHNNYNIDELNEIFIDNSDEIGGDHVMFLDRVDNINGMGSPHSSHSYKAATASIASEASLSNSEKEQLFLQLEYCLVKIFQQLGNKKMFLVAGRQAMVSCCHFVVDDIMTSLYPWFSSLPSDQEVTATTPATTASGRQVAVTAQEATLESIREINIRLRRLVHHGLSDFIDPTRLYTSPVLMSALIGSSKISMANPHAMGRSKYYTTSTAIKATLSDCRSDKAKRFFGKSQSLHVSLPGVNNGDPHLNGPPSEDNMEQSSATLFTPQKHKPLNFKRLFNDQPTANYFPKTPSQRPSTTERPTSPPEIVKNTEIIEQILQKKLSISTLPPPTRAQTAPTRIEPIPRSCNSNFSHRSCQDTNGMSDFGGLFAQGGDDSNNYFSESKKLSPKLRATTTGGLNNNNSSNRQQQQQHVEDNEDASQMSDLRSLAFNPRSEQQISLKAKALLMNMVVNKATTVYSKQMSSRQSRSRTSLLEGL